MVGAERRNDVAPFAGLIGKRWVARCPAPERADLGDG